MRSDKNQNKTKFTLVPMDAIAAVADVFDKGIKGDRFRDGWMLLEWDDAVENQYLDALMRHVQKFRESDTFKESLTHIASVATNACILWWHTKRESERVEKTIK